MKKILFILIISIIYFSCSSTKLNKNRRVNYGKMVYTKYDVITQDAADSSNKGFLGALGWMAKDIDSTKQKEFLESDSHDAMKTVAKNDSINFELNIYPEYFYEPYKWNNGKFTGKYKYTKRDSLYQCLKKTQEEGCSRKEDLRYFDESKYRFEYLKNDKKKIFGYQCFKINVIKTGDLSHIYEMYVTDKVSLNYNPIINFKSINEKYLILEVIKKTSMVGIYTKYEAKFLELKN